MKRFNTYVLAAIGLLLVAVLADRFSSTRALAQTIQAALVKNVDEPGRNPYQASVSTNCWGTYCFLSFPAVPAGKRLVIEHVAGWIVAGTNSSTIVAALRPQGTAGNLDANPSDPVVPLKLFDVTQDAQQLGVNTPVHFYAEEGESPKVTIFSDAGLGTTAFSLTGYLIDKSL